VTEYAIIVQGRGGEGRVNGTATQTYNPEILISTEYLSKI
jgi:hypothetical protein